jgi:hypothetical protein
MHRLEKWIGKRLKKILKNKNKERKPWNDMFDQLNYWLKILLFLNILINNQLIK